MVASISSFQGYYTEGALEVGKSSTQAVTKSCIAILIADYVLAQILLNMIEIKNINKDSMINKY